MKLRPPRQPKPKPLTDQQKTLCLKIENQPVQLSDFKGNLRRIAGNLLRKKVLVANGDGMFGTTLTYRIDHAEIARRTRPAKPQGQDVQPTDNQSGVPA